MTAAGKNHQQPVLLRPGDVFCVEKGLFPFSILERIVSLFEERDIEALPLFVHSGIVANECGKTLEARTRVRYWDLSHYEGREIIIARLKEGMPREVFLGAFRKICLEHYREIYPVNRLFLHSLGLAKLVHFHKVVCSELVAEFLKYALEGKGAPELNHYFGWTPADLAEIFLRWATIFEVVYQGKWSSSLLTSQKAKWKGFQIEKRFRAA